MEPGKELPVGQAFASVMNSALWIQFKWQNIPRWAFASGGKIDTSTFYLCRAGVGNLSGSLDIFLTRLLRMKLLL